MTDKDEVLVFSYWKGDCYTNVYKSDVSNWFKAYASWLACRIKCLLGAHDYECTKETSFDCGELWSCYSREYRCRKCGKHK